MARVKPDTSIVDLHRSPSPELAVMRIEGTAHVVRETTKVVEPLSVGLLVRVGDIVALGPQGFAEVGPFSFHGGRRGRSHALVKPDAFSPNPSRADVRRLMAQLARIEEEVESSSEDPLTHQVGPKTPYERAQSAEFAAKNLDLDTARKLAFDVASELRAVCLFTSEETAFVAVDGLSVAKLRRVIGALGCPVNPHLVTAEVLDALLERVYGSA